MRYSFINKYSDFILNETLQTHEIDLTIRNVREELSLLRYNFSIEKYENKINIRLHDVNKTQSFKLLLDNLNNLLIDRHGWFPSKMNLENLYNLKNLLKYDEDYILNNYIYLKSIEISYEPKFDIETDSPDKLYHLTIQEYEKSIGKFGIIPKSKNKLSRHLDRIYVCINSDDCYKLINQMRIHYLNTKFNVNRNWVIYEIDNSDLKLKLYKDPNYKGGYYCIENIPPKNLKIFDSEK
jgi:hypothetical protein